MLALPPELCHLEPPPKVSGPQGSSGDVGIVTVPAAQVAVNTESALMKHSAQLGPSPGAALSQVWASSLLTRVWGQRPGLGAGPRPRPGSASGWLCVTWVGHFPSEPSSSPV